MPTTPMASAIGMRINASSIMAHRPMSASLTSGGGLGGAALAGREGLVDVHQAGEGDHRRHEIDERADRDLDDVGGVAVAADAARLDPHLPGEKEHDRRAERVHGAHEGFCPAWRQHAVDEIHGDMLVGVRYQRQAGEDQHQQRELGNLERAAQREIEQVARHHVDEGDEHQDEQDRRGRDAEHRVGAPLPAGLHGYLPDSSFFSSWRNSASTLAPSTFLAFAALIHSSSSTLAFAMTSLTNAGLALAICTPLFFSPSSPFWSAASHDLPLVRATCS